MARYFFHLHDGTLSPDLIGTELPDREAAMQAAVRASGEAIKDLPHDFWTQADWRMIVADEHGEVLFTLRFGLEGLSAPNSRVETHRDQQSP
jgi:hypothetical protein